MICGLYLCNYKMTRHLIFKKYRWETTYAYTDALIPEKRNVLYARTSLMLPENFLNINKIKFVSSTLFIRIHTCPIETGTILRQKEKRKHFWKLFIRFLVWTENFCSGFKFIRHSVDMERGRLAFYLIIIR